MLPRGGFAPKIDRSQLAPLASPYAERGHYGGAADLESPPEQVRGYRMRVKRGDDQMDKVYGDCEIEDEF